MNLVRVEDASQVLAHGWQSMEEGGRGEMNI